LTRGNLPGDGHARGCVLRGVPGKEKRKKGKRATARNISKTALGQ